MSAHRTTPLVPKVYAAISAITAELAQTGIAKAHFNAADRYAYRSIDDVMARLAPLLARHKLCILPRVLERVCTERRETRDALLIGVALRVGFDFVCVRDGSTHTLEGYGEALDGGDKATSKAMSAAYKQVVLQAFCIPTESSEDADGITHKLKTSGEVPDPDQGWDQWAFDIQDMIRICESEEALDRVQNTYKGHLRAASRRRPDLFTALGAVIRGRREVLRGAPPPPPLPCVKRAGPKVAAAAGVMVDG